MRNRYLIQKTFNSLIAFGIFLPFIYLSIGGKWFPVIIPIICYLCLSAIIILIFLISNIKLKNIVIIGKVIRNTPNETDKNGIEGKENSKIEYEILYNNKKYKIVEIITSNVKIKNKNEVNVYINKNKPELSTIKPPMDLIKGSFFILIFLFIVFINLKKLIIIYLELKAVN